MSLGCPRMLLGIPWVPWGGPGGPRVSLGVPGVPSGGPRVSFRGHREVLGVTGGPVGVTGGPVGALGGPWHCCPPQLARGREGDLELLKAQLGGPGPPETLLDEELPLDPRLYQELCAGAFDEHGLVSPHNGPGTPKSAMGPPKTAPGPQKTALGPPKLAPWGTKTAPGPQNCPSGTPKSAMGTQKGHQDPPKLPRDPPTVP